MRRTSFQPRAPLPVLIGLIGVLGLIAPRPGWAQEAEEEEPHGLVLSEGPFTLSLAGYGDVQFSWLGYGENQNRDGGAQRDSRLVFDAARFVLEIEGELEDYDLEFEAEIELEHGGTGAAMELEYEEFGEFESEVEAGGEVLLEEIYIEKGFGDWLSLKLGRFYLALGLLSDYHEPTDYLAADRPESTTTILPGVWDELGVGAELHLGPVEVTAQVVNGLDSTGFDSKYWIRNGHQGRFELVRATDLAYVLRADWVGTDGLLVGVSGYYGNTTRNRPKADLVPACEASSEDEVAPCGFISAAVMLADLHARLELGGLRGAAVFTYGFLEESERISERNGRLSNALNVARTPVGSQAIAFWTEWGYDLAPHFGWDAAHRLEPHVRFEYYDSMFRTSGDVFDNPRFERYLYWAGLSYTLAEAFTAKLDFVHRDLGSDALRSESAVRSSIAFVF